MYKIAALCQGEAAKKRAPESPTVPSNDCSRILAGMKLMSKGRPEKAGNDN